MSGPTLFELKPIFDGPGLNEDDTKRLTGQLKDVFELMLDGNYRSLAAIRAAIGAYSEAGISARLRDLRKTRNGGHTVVRRRVGEGRGLYEYRLVPRGAKP